MGEMNLDDAPLGSDVIYAFEYQPDLLFPIARAESRVSLGIDERQLPFQGFDRWTAFELSWLNAKGKPMQAIAEFDFPVDSPNIIESKSFKLYLNSFNQTHFESQQQVHLRLMHDLSEACGKTIHLGLFAVDEYHRKSNHNHEVLDELDVACDIYDTDKSLLQTDTVEAQSKQMFRFDGFRSLCPVTSQPDWATVFIETSAKTQALNNESLLRYLVSFRNHQGFHEQCVEQIYTDLSALMSFDELTVYARFLRRGGLDINPIRSSHKVQTPMLVLDRQ